MNDPDLGVWTYTYNALGELLSQTDAKGQTTTNTYDLLGRPATRTAGGNTTTWTYDTITDAVGQVIERLSYDPHGKRRNVNWTPAPGLLAAIHTDRGFTGHEHLDDLGLIHMTKSPGAILNSRRLAPQGRGQGQPE